jgi:hypothetical protein
MRKIDIKTAWWGIFWLGFVPGFCVGGLWVGVQNYNLNSRLSRTSEEFKRSVVCYKESREDWAEFGMYHFRLWVKCMNGQPSK